MDEEILEGNNSINNEINENLNASSPKQTSKKKYIIIGVIIGVLLLAIATVVVLAIKLKWFEKEEEIYNLDYEIKTQKYQVEYFKETKKITTKIGHSKGVDERLQTVKSDIMVLITDKVDLVNYATILILDSKIIMEDKEERINSFNILDPKVVEEFESKPNGEKYPMAKFSYYNNGTLIDILLPKDMDKYNAQSFVSIIGGITPKLARNRTEDVLKGIEVNVTEDKNSDEKSHTEVMETKDYTDKYTNKTFEGSYVSKRIIRTIKNKLIKSIITKINLKLKTQKKKDVINLGLEKLDFDVQSNIVLTKSEESQKDYVSLVNKLSEKLEFMKSDDLLKKLYNEEDKQVVPKKETKALRNLGNNQWDGTFQVSKELLTIDILGKKIVVKFIAGIAMGKAKCVIEVSCGRAKIEFGMKDVTKSEKKPKINFAEFPLLTFPFPFIPFLVNVDFLVCSSFGFDLQYKYLPAPKVKDFNIELTGAVGAKAQMRAGIGKFIEIAGGVKGDILSAEAKIHIMNKSGKYTSRTEIKFSTARIELFVTGTLVWFEVFSATFEVFKGIGLKTITF